MAVWIAQKTINTSMYGAYYMCGFNWINQLMFFHLASCSVVSVQTYFVAPVGSACLFAAMWTTNDIVEET